MFRLVLSALVVAVLVFAEETKLRRASPQVFEGQALDGIAYHAGLVVGNIAPKYPFGEAPNVIARSATLRCNGVFVERDWVLTSRSCVSMQEQMTQDTGVFFTRTGTGDSVDASSTQLWTVMRSVVPDDDNVNLALVQLMPKSINGDVIFNTDATVPTPVPIADIRPVESDALTVTGFGCTNQYNAGDAPGCSLSGAARKATATTSATPTSQNTGSISEPIDATNPNLFWTDNRMCFGDQGGPAVNADGELVGIFADASQGCGDSDGWSAFTDVTMFKEWIEEQTSCENLQVVTTNGQRTGDTDVYACFQVDDSVMLPSELHLTFPSADWKLAGADSMADWQIEGVVPEVTWVDKQGKSRTDRFAVAVESDTLQVRFPAPFEYTEGNYGRRVKLYFTGVVNPNNCEGGKYVATAWPCNTFNLMNANPEVLVRRCAAEPVSLSVSTAGNGYSDVDECLFCDKNKFGMPHNTPRECSLCNSCQLMYTTGNDNKVYKCEANGLTMFRTNVPTGELATPYCDPLSNGLVQPRPNPYRQAGHFQDG